MTASCLGRDFVFFGNVSPAAVQVLKASNGFRAMQSVITQTYEERGLGRQTEQAKFRLDRSIEPYVREWDPESPLLPVLTNGQPAPSGGTVMTIQAVWDRRVNNASDLAEEIAAVDKLFLIALNVSYKGLKDIVPDMIQARANQAERRADDRRMRLRSGHASSESLFKTSRRKTARSSRLAVRSRSIRTRWQTLLRPDRDRRTSRIFPTSSAGLIGRHLLSR